MAASERTNFRPARCRRLLVFQPNAAANGYQSSKTRESSRALFTRLYTWRTEKYELRAQHARANFCNSSFIDATLRSRNASVSLLAIRCKSSLCDRRFEAAANSPAARLSPAACSKRTARQKSSSLSANFRDLQRDLVRFDNRSASRRPTCSRSVCYEAVAQQQNQRPQAFSRMDDARSSSPRPPNVRRAADIADRAELLAYGVWSLGRPASGRRRTFQKLRRIAIAAACLHLIGTIIRARRLPANLMIPKCIRRASSTSVL